MTTISGKLYLKKTSQSTLKYTVEKLHKFKSDADKYLFGESSFLLPINN